MDYLGRKINCALYDIFFNNTFTIFFFQAEDGIRDWSVTGVQTCALPISNRGAIMEGLNLGIIKKLVIHVAPMKQQRSEEHTSELQSLTNLVCRLLLEKKKKNKK